MPGRCPPGGGRDKIRSTKFETALIQGPAHGFRAVMVTDTFFRNRHYHQESDTIDTLNFDQMAEVVKGLYFTLLNL